MKPAFPIIDAHVHLWQPERLRMSWFDENVLLNRPYLLDVYDEHTKDLPIEALVFMECGVEPQYAFLEAQWAVQYAEQDSRLQGIIAAAPLEFGSRLQVYLEALVGLGPKIKGIRRNIEGEEDSNMCLRPAFVQGVHLAATYQLTIDLCLRHWQLPAVTELVRLCPETQFMLDHLGKPPVSAHILDPWRQQIKDLAALPNVSCKISGLVTEADAANWTEADLAPYIEHIWQTFGEDRVVFASDWPVMLSASTYTRWIETLQAFLATVSSTAQRKFWQENARRFYRLATPGK